MNDVTGYKKPTFPETRKEFNDVCMEASQTG